MYIYYSREDKIKFSVMEFLNAKLARLSRSDKICLQLTKANISANQLIKVINRLKDYRIIELDLSNNHIGDYGAQLLAAALKTSRIQKLILKENDIADRGAEAIAQAIVYRRPDLTVDLQSNKIGPAGGVALVKAVVQTNSKVFNLTSNKLGDDGAEAIAKVLKKEQGQLEQLILTYNGIQDRGDKALSDNVPSTIAIRYRVKQVPFMEAHPIISTFLLLFFPIFLLILPFMKADIPIDGLKCEQKRRQV